MGNMSAPTPHRFAPLLGVVATAVMRPTRISPGTSTPFTAISPEGPGRGIRVAERIARKRYSRYSAV